MNITYDDLQSACNDPPLYIKSFLDHFMSINACKYPPSIIIVSLPQI